MFRVSFFVDDKHLASVMRALAGRTKDLQVVPVTNVEQAPNGELRQAADNNFEMILKELKHRKLEAFRPKQMRDILQEVGLSPMSYGHFLNQLVKMGTLTKKGKGKLAIYGVVQK